MRTCRRTKSSDALGREVLVSHEERDDAKKAMTAAMAERGEALAERDKTLVENARLRMIIDQLNDALKTNAGTETQLSAKIGGGMMWGGEGADGVGLVEDLTQERHKINQLELLLSQKRNETLALKVVVQPGGLTP